MTCKNNGNNSPRPSPLTVRLKYSENASNYRQKLAIAVQQRIVHPRRVKVAQVQPKPILSNNDFSMRPVAAT